jgi:hypothetical protein
MNPKKIHVPVNLYEPLSDCNVRLVRLQYLLPQRLFNSFGCRLPWRSVAASVPVAEDDDDDDRPRSFAFCVSCFKSAGRLDQTDGSCVTVDGP